MPISCLAIEFMLKLNITLTLKCCFEYSIILLEIGIHGTENTTTNRAFSSWGEDQSSECI